MQQAVLSAGGNVNPLVPDGGWWDMDEAVLIANASALLAGQASLDGPAVCFTQIWIAKGAQFRPCFLPVLAALPALLAAVVLLGQILRALVPWRPRWMRPFVRDLSLPEVEVELVRKRRWSAHATWVLGFATLGFVLALARACLRSPRASGFFPVAAWFVAVLQLVVFRPRTVPYAVLGIVAAELTVRVVLLSNSPWRADSVHVLDLCAIVTAVLVLLIFLLMPFRDPLLPSKDISSPFTEPTSTLRSPEEALTVWQFMTVSWVSPLMSVGCQRQLEDEDVWALPYEFQHTFLHENFRLLKGTVIRRLLSANAIDLFITIVLGVMEQLMTYAGPVLLQLLLQAMEEPGVPQRVPLMYALLTLVTKLLATQLGVFNLWFGRRCYERSRGEMITMLYEKTLDRKISAQDALPPDTLAGGNASDGDVDPPKLRSKIWRGLVRAVQIVFARNSDSKPKERASMGKILNLMRNDVYEVAQRFWEFDKLIRVPLSTVLSVTLVVNYLGWSSLLGVSVVLVAQVLNALLARLLVFIEKRRRAATDKKLQVTSQFIEALRHLRWYGWQGAWLTQIMDARQKELTLRIISSLCAVTIGVVNSLALDTAPVVAFFAYTVISHRSLSVDIAFPAMALFSMLTANLRELPALVMTLINAWVAVGRIEDFMAEPDREEMATEALIGEKVSLEKATFAWPGASVPVLMDIDASFPVGLNVICGEVAAGKTALLQALLGELDMTRGRLLMPSEPIGYCAQTPWLQSMSIRENILFSAPYDDVRYKAVLDACALTPDLAGFKAGDLSLIGENGIGLSGGQRARVALARAVYSRTKLLLLDDPLSALDQQTAEAIVQNCLLGPLLQGRTVILVTHRTDLVLGHAVQTIKVESGKASVVSPEVAAKIDHPRSDASSTTATPGSPADDAENAKALAAAVPDKFIEDEHREQGGVKADVYWQYVKAGTLWLWGFLILTLAMYRGFALAEAWFIKVWAEAYQNSPRMAFFTQLEDLIVHPTDILDDFPPPEVDPMPWLLVLLSLALAQSLAYILSQTTAVFVVYTAGKNMFREVMDRVAHATFRFYDTTPVGRLMNRMTSDISVIDGNICYQFQAISYLGISWISSVAVIATVTPTFLVFTAALSVLFVVIFRRFISTSQSLRRLEMVSLTPLMSNFGALLEGLATVRAFRAQSRFQRRVIEVVDTFQRMDHFYWSAQAWIQYRYDILSALANFLLFVLAVSTGLSPGLTAFVLLAASKFVSSTHALCRQYGQLQMEFVSVERVVELLHLEQEPKGSLTPPAWWPSFSGTIAFDDVTIKYAPHLDPALQNISFTIPAGSKTAILGRTGSGKSTLALALLATILPTAGSITIDNIDLAAVDKHVLRSKITFLAQDPVLFPGSMQDNLDPLHEFEPDACAAVLDRVCSRQGWTLASPIEAGGKNLSQGQRQLVGLARAVLRRSAIIILDEATASIDRETADQIQQVMHEDLRASTVITIAHRLEAVRNADYCVVLAAGKVLEHGPAAAMLRERAAVVGSHVDVVDGDAPA